jgi:RHS repeat-associated protein
MAFAKQTGRLTGRLYLAALTLVAALIWSSGALAQSEGRPTAVTQTDTTTFTTPYATGGRTRTWGYTWSASGQLLTATDPLSHTTTYAYNSSGYLASVTNAASQTTTVTAWDWRGAPTSVTDANGTVTTFTYDIHGRPLTITLNPGSAQSQYQFAYNVMGDVTQITLPGGGYLQYTYDTARRVTLITNQRGETRAFTYDLNDDPLTETVKDGSGTITRQSSAAYDELGRIIQSLGAGASQTTTLAYDKLSNLTSVTDPLSHARQNAFDPLNRVITETNPDSQTVQHSYNGQDNLTSQADGRSLTTSRVVDGFGEVIQETSPDRGTRVYTYDAAGNLTKLVDGDGQETDYAYDALNRRTAMTFPSASTENVAYTYDSTTGGNAGVGRLTGVTEESGSTALTYDAQGRLVTDAKVIWSRGYSVAYAYDANGKVTQITYPSGRIVTISRASDGQVTGITTTPSGGSAQTIAASVTYAPFGPLTGFTYGNGYQLARSYDQNYWMTRIQVTSGSTTAFDLGFQTRTDGRLGEVDDNAATGRGVTAISYTPSGRLSGATGPWGQESWSFDAAGNRTGDVLTVGGVTTTHNEVIASASNRLSSVRDAASNVLRSFTWTSGGALATDTATGGDAYAYSYDYRKRLASVSKNGTQVGVYGYDYLGQRVARQVGTQTTDYVFDEDGHLLAEHDGATGAVLKEYVWLGDTPVAVIDSTSGAPATYYITAGRLDEPQQLIDGSGTKVWDAYLNPWGAAQTFATATASIDLRLPGQWTQAETNGLSQNHFRDYSPSTGRYIEADPIGLEGGPVVYAYADDDPLSLADPEGLASGSRRYVNFRTRMCTGPEKSTCEQQCEFGMESCRVVQQFRVTRVYNNGVCLTERKWADGPMSCSCNEPPSGGRYSPAPAPKPSPAKRPRLVPIPIPIPAVAPAAEGLEGSAVVTDILEILGLAAL